jgi:hypothetical protein
MSKPGTKRFILVFEDHQVVSVSAARFKLNNGVEFYDAHGDCVAAAPSSKLLLVTEADHLETMDDLSEMDDMEDDDDLLSPV